MFLTLHVMPNSYAMGHLSIHPRFGDPSYFTCFGMHFPYRRRLVMMLFMAQLEKGVVVLRRIKKTCKNYGFVKMSKMKMVFRLKSLSSTSLNTNYNWDTKGAPSTSTNL